MQQRAIVIFALLASPVLASSVSASSAASAWLQSHKSPTNDQLGELQNANPAAFALVSALLNKHAHGQIKLAPEERGPDVFRAMMTPRHLSAASPNVHVPYASAELAEVSRPVVDQAHYNPNAAADRDESAVSRLLAAVAQLGGKKGKKIALLNHHRKKQQVESGLANDANLFADSNPAPAAQVQAVEEQVAAAVQPPVQEEQATPAPKRENSYLKGIDLSGDMPAVATKAHKHTVVHDDGIDRLASFSFGDAAPATPAPKKVVAAKPKPANMFLKWLSGTKKAPAPEEEAPVSEKKQVATNPYAGWLGL